MKRIARGIVSWLFAAVLLFPAASLAADVTTTLAVDGMTCGLCAKAVTKALEQVEGVEDAKVSFQDKRAVVVADEAVKIEALITAVRKAGYKARAASTKANADLSAASAPALYHVSSV